MGASVIGFCLSDHGDSPSLRHITSVTCFVQAPLGDMKLSIC